MLLFSKTLSRDINFATYEKENDFGQPMKIIFHDSLEEVIHNEKGVKYAYNFIRSDIDHSVVECTMIDASGRRVSGIGETIPQTLDNDIARNYPTLIATQRAFDRAAIRYLDLPGKVFSNLEISVIDNNFVDIEKTKADDTVVPSIGIVSSVVEDNDVMNISYDEEIEVTADIATEPEEEPADSTTEFDALSNQPVMEDFDLASMDIEDIDFDEETTEEDDYSDYVITMQGKYAGKNKTIAEIYATDTQWITWIAKNFIPHTAVAEEDVAAIRKFVAKKEA